MRGSAVVRDQGIRNRVERQQLTQRGLAGDRDRAIGADLPARLLGRRLLGRRAEAEDTAELLAPYGEWQGLASAYLLAGFGAGLLPVPAQRGLPAAA